MSADTPLKQAIPSWLHQAGLAIARTKQKGSETWYDLRACPFNESHTDGAALVWGPGDSLGFRCHHDGCKGKKLADLVELIGLPDGMADRPARSKQKTGQASPGGRPGLPVNFRIQSLDDLLQKTYDEPYLIPGVVAARQPMIITGPPKSCKTSIMLDLVFAVATGAPFLGTFQVEHFAANPLIFSGESGEAKIVDTIRRIARNTKTKPEGTGIGLAFAVPRLSLQDQLCELEAQIVKRKAELVAIDPFYMAALTGSSVDQSSNVFAMGDLLGRVGQIAERTGITLVICHHDKKGAKIEAEPPDGLERAAGAGVAEWARQWLSIARRVKYARDGWHRLWLSWGGSMGHSGAAALDLDEGQKEDMIAGACWRPTIGTVEDADRDAEKRQANVDEDLARQKVQQAIVAIQQAGHPLSQNQLKEAMGCSLGKAKGHLAWGETQGLLKSTKDGRTILYGLPI